MSKQALIRIRTTAMVAMVCMLMGGCLGTCQRASSDQEARAGGSVEQETKTDQSATEGTKAEAREVAGNQKNITNLSDPKMVALGGVLILIGLFAPSVFQNRAYAYIATGITSVVAVVLIFMMI